jgi:DNA polymerase/3'-5' exonuclease PolX
MSTFSPSFEAAKTDIRAKVPADYARAVAEEIQSFLQPHCLRIEIAGSLRRRKEAVSDAEILFIPKCAKQPSPEDFFAERIVNQAEQAIETLLRTGVLEKRPNVNGVVAWGANNKLGRETSSGLAVDLFTATERNWFNYLVCRTGGAENNVRICNAAIAKGWKWNPYGVGFSRPQQIHFASNGMNLDTSQEHVVQSEREVFEFVGLPYLEPWERV